jgi:DNA-binding HxlR family transcriptional regulator
MGKRVADLPGGSTSAIARHRSFEEMNCSIARALDVIGEWWTLLVVREAFRGVRRFDAFVERLGIAPNILSVRLKKLVRHGVLESRKYADHPERFEYKLTAKGRQLFPVIIALLVWGDRWYAEEGAPAVLVHDACGHVAAPRLTCGHCGEPLDPRETHAVPGPGARDAAPSLIA